MRRTRVRAQFRADGTVARTVRSTSGLSATKSQRQKSERLSESFGQPIKVAKPTGVQPRYRVSEAEDVAMPALRVRKHGR